MSVYGNEELAHADERPLSGLIDLLATLRRRLPLVLMCAVLVPAVAVTYLLHKPKLYTAHASLLFDDPGSVQQQLGYMPQATEVDPTVEQATDSQLTQLPVVATATTAALHGRVTPAQVSSDVSVSNNGQSSVFTVSASNTDPHLAAQLANTYAQQFVAFRRNADRAKVESAITLIERQIASLPLTAVAQRHSLQQDLGQLQLLAALQTGNAEVVQTAQTPASPSSPNPFLAVALGLGLGVLLGIGLALLTERLDRRLKDPDEISRAFNRPILATIPENSRLAAHTREAEFGQLGSLSAEAFRTLRANLRYFNVDRGINSVLITSAVPNDGKSTVALNLALAAAEAGTRTLLIEADWRHPVMAQWLGLDTTSGLSGVLAGDADVGSAVFRVPVSGDGSSNGSGRSVDVLVAGPQPPNPSELIESERMLELFCEANQKYELLVIDTPPISAVADAVPMINVVSGIVVVAALGTTTRESAVQLRSELENLNAHVLGVVVNRAKRSSGGGYGYAYYENSAERRLAVARRSNEQQGLGFKSR